MLKELLEKASQGRFRAKKNGDVYCDGYYIGTTQNSKGEVSEIDRANAELIARLLNIAPVLPEVVACLEDVDNVFGHGIAEDGSAIQTVIETLAKLEGLMNGGE